MDGSSYHIMKFHPALDGYMVSIYHIMKFHPALDGYMDGSISHIMKFHPSFYGWNGWNGHALFYVPICAPNCHLMNGLEWISLKALFHRSLYQGTLIKHVFVA